MMFLRFKAGATPMPRYTGAQYYNRAKIAYSLRAGPAQVRRSSAAAVSKRRAFHRHAGPSTSRSSALDAVRYRPGLRPGSQKASFWSMHGYPFWHRRGCTWVHSEGDPRRAQRDKDCPACQEHIKMPVELSQRELMWQRQLQFVREWIDRDPYDAMFGWSNDLRKGIPRRDFWNKRLLRRFGMDGIVKNDNVIKATEPDEPSWRKGIFQKHDWERPSEDHPKSTNPFTGSNVENNPVTSKNPKETPASEKSTIRGWGHWKVSSTDASGRVTEQSGDMIYDPISMRMIPTKTSPDKLGPQKETFNAPVSPPEVSEAQQIPVKKFDESLGAQTSPQVSSGNHDTSIPEPSATVKEETGLAQSSAEQAIPLQSPQLGITIPERRLNLIRRAERAMALAQSHLAFLSTKPERVGKRPVTAVELQETIKRLQRAKHAFRNLQQTNLTKDEVGRVPQAATQNVESPMIASKSYQKSPSPVKEALESSWAKEHSNKQQNKSAPQAFGRKSPPEEAYSGNAVQQSLTAEEARSTGQKCTSPVLKRDKALKHMTASELGLHRAALLKTWAKKHQQSPQVTPAERKLNEEIRIQKNAMAAYESRPKIKATSTASNTKIAADGQPHHPGSINAVGAEGDLSPHAVQFAERERWYKKTAPHALKKEQEKMHDRALVAEIKDIYEQTYGLIDENHRQGKASNPLNAPSVEQEEPLTTSETTSSRSESNHDPEKSTPPASVRNLSRPPLPAQSAMFQILAYDRKTKSVHTASAPASYSPPSGSNVLSLTNALERLHHPAKFLPFISQLHADGYEIVSANKHLLVFKEISTGSLIDKLAIKELKSVTKESSKGNRIEAEARLNTLINEYAIANNTSQPSRSSGRPKPSSVPSSSNPRVRKEEPIFSGRSLNEPIGSDGQPPKGPYWGRKQRRSASTRFFLITGKLSVAAACVYLLGCIIEELYGLNSEDQHVVPVVPSKAMSSDLASPELSVVAAKKIDKTDPSDYATRTGFWAAVNKEQARRADAKQSEALRKEANEQKQAFSSSNLSLTASHATAAAFDVALFSTALWVVMKILDIRS